MRREKTREQLRQLAGAFSAFAWAARTLDHDGMLLGGVRLLVLCFFPEIVAEDAEFRYIDCSGELIAAISITGSSTLTAMNTGAGTRRRTS